MTFQKLFRDPLVHFLGIGLLLFAAYSLVGPAGGDGDEIVISRAMVADMKAQHQKLWGRPPTEAELNGLIETRIADEILYREGLAMGLDRNDAVIKRRVRQKYELIAEEENGAAPTEADLEAYLAANRAKFRAPPVVSVTQVLVPTDGTREEVEARVAALKAALAAGADPSQAGKATLLPASIRDQRLDLVARDFGDRFAQALATRPVGNWQGPVVSGYGLHLVRIDSRTPAAEPTLDAVRAEVQREWENDRREKARAARLAQLRSQYDVVIEK